jgi:hypothetical protein
LIYRQPEQDDIIIHDLENPRLEAHNFVKGVVADDVKQANICVVLGLGMGYYLEALINEYGRTAPLFIVVENNLHLFKQYITHVQPMVNVGGNTVSLFDFQGIRFFVGVPPDEIYNAIYGTIQGFSRSSFSTFFFVEHPVLIRFNKEYYKPLIDEITRVCYDVRSSYGNDPEDSWFGVDNMLRNIDIIGKNAGVKETFEKFKGKPAIIVATGPSLNKNIHLLPKLKNKAVFFAADASLNTFFNYDKGDIRPEIVCSLERNLTTQRHFRQIKPEKKHLMNDMYLCACPVVKPELYDAWEGKHMVIYRDFAHFRWLDNDKGILNTGKSVTNMAFMVAYAMGCDPIILCGQDLAFAPDGKTHVKGADHASEGLKASPLMNQTTQVRGNNGQMLNSLDTWVGMLRRFEYDIAHYPDRTYINATEGGALIRGTQVMTLQEVMDKYMTEEFDVMGTLDGAMQKPSEEQAKADLERMDSQITKGIDYVKWGLKKINKVLSDMELAFDRISKDQMEDWELMDVLKYCEQVKNEILAHEMCFYTVMHVIQSWMMGRENVFAALPTYYRDRELGIAKGVRIFEYFYGMKILFEHIDNGIAENYKSTEALQVMSESPYKK